MNSREKVMVGYDHDPADLNPIYLALTDGGEPTDEQWSPALRDTIDGLRVVWVYGTANTGQVVWLRDRHGQRPVQPQAAGSSCEPKRNHH